MHKLDEKYPIRPGLEPSEFRATYGPALKARMLIIVRLTCTSWVYTHYKYFNITSDFDV